VLPGHGWARAGRWTHPWLAGCVLSWLLLFLGILSATFLKLPLTLPVLGGFLLLTGLPGYLRAWTQGWRPDFSLPSREYVQWPLLLALPMLLVAVGMATQHPLSGADTAFRWDRLARLMVEQGSLAHYPAFSAEDFEHYYWPESISPLVAGQYAWTYLCAGAPSPLWTAVPVLLQWSVLLGLLFRLGSRWGGGPRAGAFALAAAGASFLLQFGCNLGQESLLQALSATGLCLWLGEWIDGAPNRSSLWPAMVCAALFACTREYGPGLVLVASGWMLVAGRRPGVALLFLCLSLLPAALWACRVWALTGNPVYSLSLGRLLPVNRVFEILVQETRDAYSQALWSRAGLLQGGRYLLIGCVWPVLGLALGYLRYRGNPARGLVLLAAAVCLLCWSASVPYTAGGLFYSMRVLAPLLALGCAWAGALVASVRARLPAALLTLLLVGGAADASLRAWAVPLNPYRDPVAEWCGGGDVRRDVVGGTELALFEEAARLSAGRKVVSDFAGILGGPEAPVRYVPLWSPELEFLYGTERVQPEALASRLRGLGYSHVIYTKGAVPEALRSRLGLPGRLDPVLRPVSDNANFLLLEIGGGRDVPAPR